MATSMGQRLAGKTVLITGASSGIGRSTAKEFARTSPGNLKLILAARRVESLQALTEEICKEVGDGVKVLPVKLDVSKPEETSRFIGNLPAEFKDIDILVNNAGLVKGVGQAPDIALQDIQTMFSTNIEGLINMTQVVLSIFKQRPEGGAGDIINIGSIAGREPYAGGSIYCATKSAVRAFTDALRRELIATRIRVIGIDPGQVETEFSIVRFYGDKSKADAVYAGCNPLTADDVAEVIVFAAGRRENVVLADSLIFPNHQMTVLNETFLLHNIQFSLKNITWIVDDFWAEDIWNARKEKGLTLRQGTDCDGEGDLVDDTPAEGLPTNDGCPICKDTCLDLLGVDPIHNYMDYADQDCQNEFTAGQEVRMYQMFNAFRKGRNFDIHSLKPSNSTTLYLSV
ncbi:hypothetical protein ACJZ2D_012633 [Fusarium nematophilum]